MEKTFKDTNGDYIYEGATIVSNEYIFNDEYVYAVVVRTGPIWTYKIVAPDSKYIHNMELNFSKFGRYTIIQEKDRIWKKAELNIMLT